MPKLIHLLVILSSNILFAQEKPAYQLFTSSGKKIEYVKMLKQLNDQDLVFFGEYHNNPISHWLTLELVKDLKKNNDLILGAEMFERDNQEALNKYLAGKINQKGLDTTTRLWPNYYTDYKPVLDFAKGNNIQFIATNVPRRYASIVNYHDWQGLDTLSKEELKWIAPLPIKFDSSVTCYKNMLTMMHDHGSMTMVKAQALKDATMAYSILQFYKKESLFFHFNGSYHSNLHEGIVWHIKQSKPDLKIMTIATVSQKDLSKLESDNKSLADFILVVDEDMTTTY